eukprot:6198108-Pleurochrysis_carterae.AAC.1
MSWFPDLARQRSPPSWEDTLRPGPLASQFGGGKCGSTRSWRTSTAASSRFSSSTQSWNVSAREDQCFAFTSQYDGSEYASVCSLRARTAISNGFASNLYSSNFSEHEDECSAMANQHTGSRCGSVRALRTNFTTAIGPTFNHQSVDTSTLEERISAGPDRMGGDAQGADSLALPSPRRLRLADDSQGSSLFPSRKDCFTVSGSSSSAQCFNSSQYDDERALHLDTVFSSATDSVPGTLAAPRKLRRHALPAQLET